MKKWDKKLYQLFSQKLEKLAIKDWSILAEKNGIKFTNEEERKRLRKQDYILVLDETAQTELISVYLDLMNR